MQMALSGTEIGQVNRLAVSSELFGIRAPLSILCWLSNFAKSCVSAASSSTYVSGGKVSFLEELTRRREKFAFAHTWLIISAGLADADPDDKVLNTKTVIAFIRCGFHNSRRSLYDGILHRNIVTITRAPVNTPVCGFYTRDGIEMNRT